MTSVAAILAGQPTVDLRTFSPAEKALAIEDVVEIVQPFFKMNPYGLFVERFRPLGKILVTSSRVHHKGGHSIDLPDDVSEDTMCMIIDHTPSQ